MPAARGPYRVDLQNPISSHPLNRGLVSWWLPLPGLTGGRRFWDLKCRFHGTLTNHTTNGSAWVRDSSGFGAVYGTAATGDYIQLPDISSAFTTDEATVMFVVKRTLSQPTSNATAGFVDFTYSGASDPTHYPLTSTDNGYFSVFRATGNRIGPITLRSDVDRTAWHTLAITTKNGTDGYRIWQNGKLTTSTTGLSAVTIEASVKFGYNQTYGLGFDGSFGSVRLWNRCLGEAEIQAEQAEWHNGFPHTIRRYPERAWFVLRESAAAAGGATIPVFAHHYRMQGIQ